MQKTSDNIIILLLLGMGGVFILVVSFIIIQIRNQNKLLRQKKKLDEAEIAHQKELLHAVIQYQEEDRKRIGQNLHDDVGGALAVLKMIIANNEGTVSVQNEPNMALIDSVIADVRNISHNLSPQMLSLLGLWDVIDELCDNINNSGKLKIKFECAESIKSIKWDDNFSIAIFRILQELVTNTLKHAEASLILLAFKLENNKIMITYQDNGKGSDPETGKGMGMANIISRLEMLEATWEVTSSKNGGYSFSMAIPVMSG